MSDEQKLSTPITFNQASAESCEDNFARFLTWLGVVGDEPVELTAKDPSNMRGAKFVVGYGYGIEAAVALAKEGDSGAQYLGAEAIYVQPSTLADGVSARVPPGKWERAEHSSDSEVVRRRTVYVDLDPDRPSGSSATASERSAAQAAAKAAATDLADVLGSAGSLGIGSSGNGFQVHVAVDMPTTPEVAALAQRFVRLMSAKYESDRWGHQIDVDQTVFNHARICPAFGTMKRKGNDHKVGPNEKWRPHRRSFFWSPVAEPKRLNQAEFGELVSKIEFGLDADQRAAFEKLCTGNHAAASPASKADDSERFKESALAVAKRHPVAEVAQWLGLYDGDDLRCPNPACSHTGNRKGGTVVILDKANVLKCSSNTCSSRRNGNRSSIDLVCEVKGYSLDKDGVRKASVEICEHFGLEFKKGRGKARKTPTVEELEAMAGISADEDCPKSAPKSKAVPNLEDEGPEVESEEVEQAKRRNLTDLGNAERLVDRHGDGIRYVPAWGKWIVWDGVRWVDDVDRIMIRRLAADTVRQIYIEASEESDIDRKNKLVSHAQSSESNKCLSAMIQLAEPMATADWKELDQDKWLLNVQNGTLDLKTGKLGPHERKNMITKVAPVDFDPNADRSLVNKFLERVQPDEDVRAYLWRLLGYSMTAEVGELVLPIHYGGGRNGKSTLLNAIQRLLGDYATQVPTELLVGSKEGHPTDRATLFGVRLAVAAETDDMAHLKTALVKQLTGGDPIACRRMREDFWQFEPTHTLHIYTNNKPVIRETKDAIWERVHLIPWTVRIPEQERDPNLIDKLVGPGLLRALVEGVLDYQDRKGLCTPEAIDDASEEYRQESDILADFIDEHVEYEDGAEVESSALYKAYSQWAKDSGMKPFSQKRFIQQLNEREIGTAGRAANSRRMVRIGIKLVGGTTASAEASGVYVDEYDPDDPNWNV